MALLVTKASEITCMAILEHEYLVIDKEGVEYLQERYNVKDVYTN
jgi:hypothetical protein